MFPKYNELVITAIIIFFNIAGISSYQDSIHFDDSYGKKLPALRRSERQTESGMCLIPNPSLNTNYKILGEFETTYKPGDNVPNFAILKITCDEGFKLSPFAQNHSVCLEGIWALELTNSSRACPSLKSTISIFIPLYEDSVKDQNLGNLCLDGNWEPSIPQCNPTAHCFTDYNGNVNSPEKYSIAAGKYYRLYDHNGDVYAQYSKIYKINIPERYRGYTTLQALDIAVLILEKPFSLSRAVQPVCIELNKQLQQLYLSSRSIGIVVGWGYTEEGGELSDGLKELEIPHIPYAKCFDEIPMSFKKYYTKDKICGGYKDNATSLCGGDSGGGLVFNDRITDRFYIKGVASTSPAIAETQICDSLQYSLYTSIADHVPFIRDVIIRNPLRYSVECEYDKCASAEPQEVDEVEEMREDAKLIEYVQQLEEVVKGLKEHFLKTRANYNNDDGCGANPKCSCINVLFSNTSTTVNVRKSAVEVIQKIDPEYMVDESIYESQRESCKTGFICYDFYAVFFTVPEQGKDLLKAAAKLIQKESATSLIDVDIFENYDKCSFSALLEQMSGKIRKIFKSYAENALHVEIKFP